MMRRGQARRTTRTRRNRPECFAEYSPNVTGTVQIFVDICRYLYMIVGVDKDKLHGSECGDVTTTQDCAGRSVGALARPSGLMGHGGFDEFLIGKDHGAMDVSLNYRRPYYPGGKKKYRYHAYHAYHAQCHAATMSRFYAACHCNTPVTAIVIVISFFLIQQRDRRCHRRSCRLASAYFRPRCCHAIRHAWTCL